MILMHELDPLKLVQILDSFFTMGLWNTPIWDLWYQPRVIHEGFSGIQNAVVALTSFDKIDEDQRFPKMQSTFF